MPCQLGVDMSNNLQNAPIRLFGMVSCLLLLFVIISSVLLVKQQWQGDLVDLFTFGGQLTLPQMASQLAILATMVVAILAGGLLTVASIALQQLVKNNLASDSTLSVGSGAQLALLMATLFLPNFGLYGSFWAAFIGALASMGVVFLLSLPSRINPMVLVLSGLVVNIFVTAIASVLLVFYSQMALGVMVWGAGALTQTGWAVSGQLLLTMVLLAVGLLLVYRPLVIMGIDDSKAQSLGVPVRLVRLVVLLLVAMATAMTVSHLGLLSFVGLAAATLVNAMSFAKLYQRLLAGFVLGGLLLWLVSNVSALFSVLFAINVPAGAMTGFLGAPLIIWLVLKNAKRGSDEMTLAMPSVAKNRSLWQWVVGLFVMMAVGVGVAPMLIDGVQLTWGIGQDWQIIKEYRLPRMLTAASVGAMLAMAGVLLQTLTRNPMASPEVLGISSGAALGVVGAFVLLPIFGMAVQAGWLLAFGTLGAGLVLLAILWLAKRVSSMYLLLVGVAISAVMSGVLAIITLLGDPRLQAVLSWLSGSTYHATLPMAVGLSVLACGLYLVCLLIAKPLRLMGLGQVVAAGRGLMVARFERWVLLLVAVLSTAATLAIGPLSFVGLMISHLAISLGATQLSKQLSLSAVLGAMLMVVADWLGRYAIFPYEIPAGTLAALVGGAYFVYLLSKSKTA